MRPSTPAVLSLLAVVTGGVLLAQGLTWQPEAPAIDVPQAPVEAKLAHAAVGGGQVASDVEALTQRPAFTSGRQPYVAAVAAADASTEAEAEVKPEVPVPAVLGLAISSKKAVAVITEADSGRTRRVAAGDEVSGWRVIAIDPERVTFGSPTIRAVVYLKKSGDQPRIEMSPAISEVAERDTTSRRPDAGPLF